MSTRIAICLIAIANLGITMIGGLTPMQRALTIAVSLIIVAEFFANVMIAAKKATK